MGEGGGGGCTPNITIDTCTFIGPKVEEDIQETTPPINSHSPITEIPPGSIQSPFTDLASELSIELDGGEESEDDSIETEQAAKTKRLIRKQTMLEAIGPKILKGRFKESDILLTETLAQLRKIHGSKAAADVLALYLAEKEPEEVFLRMVSEYKAGFIEERFNRKLKLSFAQEFGVGDAVNFIDNCSGVNFSGLEEIFQRFRPMLPPNTLPSKKAISQLKKTWAAELTIPLDLQPININGKCVGYDVDPLKFISYLLENVYSELQKEVCVPKESGKVYTRNSRYVTIVDEDPQLSIGDWLTVGGRMLRVDWIRRPMDPQSPNVYLMGPLPGSTITTFDEQYNGTCGTYQRAIVIVRTLDGRVVIGRSQVAETLRFINQGLKCTTNHVDDVWVSMVVSGPENLTTVSEARKRQRAGLKSLIDAGQINLEGCVHPFPIKLWGPADLKNHMLMHQQGGNPGTTKKSCPHCNKDSNCRGEIHWCGTIRYTRTAGAISELGPRDSPLCVVHGDARIVEKDVDTWAELAEKAGDQYLEQLAVLIRKTFGETSNFKFYRSQYLKK